MSAPNLVTNSMLWKKLEEVKLRLFTDSYQSLLNEFQEISLNEAAKLLKMSAETLRRKVKDEEIECLVDGRSNATDGIKISFLPRHIKNYQERRLLKGSEHYREIAKSELDKVIQSGIK